MRRKHSSYMLSLLGAFAVVAALVSPPAAHAVRPRAGFQGTITVYAQAYSPPGVVKTVPGQTVQTHNAPVTVADAWERAHPGVHIKFVNLSAAPGQDYYGVLRTRLTGGTAPDVFYFQPGSTQDQFLRAGLIADLTPYLMKPNRYIPGNKVWNDSFRAPWQSYGRTQSGQYATVPLDRVSTGVYYNTSITSKLGLRMPPTSWAEFMQDQQKVQAAGYLPMYGPSFCFVKCHWYWSAIGSQFMHADVKYAALKYHSNYIPGWVMTEDWARAVTKLGWRPSKDPGLVAAVQNFRDWSRYFAPGWASDTTGTTKEERLFASGRLAFVWDGTWELLTFNQLKLPFKYESFWFPPVTRQTSPLAPNPPMTPPGVGCICSISFAVSNSIAHTSKMPLAMDFLQYLTAPKNDQTIVNEQPSFLPEVKGTNGDPAIANLFKGEAALAKTAGQVPVEPVNDLLTPADMDKWFRYTVLFLQGATSQSDYLRQLDALAVDSARTQIAQNDKTKNKAGTWDLTKW